MRKGSPWIALVLSLISTGAPARSDPEKIHKVSGFGGHPISDDLTSMWLSAPDRQPLIMVYFHGREGWHKTEWKISSKFETGAPGWAEFTSDTAKQRIWLDPETGQAEIQTAKFNTHEANTFLALHMGETSDNQKVIPMGIFNLPKSTDEPASVLLLRASPELVEKIKGATVNGAGN